MSDQINDQWSKLSLLVANDTDSFENWENLVKFASTNLTKTTPSSSLEIFRLTNDQFLLKYPLMEHYWLEYAQIEFKLGFTEKARTIYKKSLEVLPNSNLIWHNYLKLLKEIDLTYDELIGSFKEAESRIGYHYHSYDYWKDFLDVERSYKGKSRYYYNLLKKVLAIPIYNFGYFFRLIFNDIDELNETLLFNMVSEAELAKRFKITTDKATLKNVDYRDAKSKLKNIFTDVYITTQFRVFEMYQFEKNIKLEYFVPGLYKSYQELTCWESYLSYVEINGTFAQTEQLYYRALVPLASYPQFWLKFSDFYLSRDFIQKARTVLYESLLLLSPSNLTDIHIRLVQVEQILNNFVKARDLAIAVLSNTPQRYNVANTEVLIELVKIEKVLNSSNPKAFEEFLITLLRETESTETTLLLLESMEAQNLLRCSVELIRSLNSTGKFSSETRYWKVLLNSLKRDKADAFDLLSAYNDGRSNTKNAEALRQWYQDWNYQKQQEDTEISSSFPKSSLFSFS